MPREPRLLLAVFDTPHRWANDPEEALRVAVLAQALHDLQTLRIRTTHAPQRARSHPRWSARIELAKLLAWFATDAEAWPYSFAALCAALDLPTAPIRREVARQIPRNVVHGARQNGSADTARGSGMRECVRNVG